MLNFKSYFLPKIPAFTRNWLRDKPFNLEMGNLFFLFLHNHQDDNPRWYIIDKVFHQYIWTAHHATIYLRILQIC